MEDFKENSRGKDEMLEGFLEGLGIVQTESGDFEKVETGTPSEEDNIKGQSDDTVKKAAAQSGVDIDLTLVPEEIVGALVITKEDFLRAFNLAIPVIQATSTVTAYKGLNLVPDVEQGIVKILSTNGLETMTYTCKKVDGVDYPMLNEPICLETSLLQKLVRVIGNQILIYRKAPVGDEKVGNLMIRLIDGDLILDLKKINEADLKVEGVKGEQLAQVPANQLNDILKTLIPIAADGFRPDDRNISFLGDRAYYKSAKYVVKYDINTPKFISKSLESEFLRRLCTAFKGNTVIFNNIEGVEARRIGVTCDNVYYTMVTATPEVMERERELLESALTKEYISVDYTTFLRIVSLAADLPRSTGAINVRAEADCLKITIESKSGNSEFTCKAEVPSTLVNNINVRLFAGPLKKLLASITTESVDIAIEKSNIFIKHDDFVAVFMNII